VDYKTNLFFKTDCSTLETLLTNTPTAKGGRCMSGKDSSVCWIQEPYVIFDGGTVLVHREIRINSCLRKIVIH